ARACARARRPRRSVLAAQQQPDLSERLTRFGEYPHVALSLGDRVRSVVLRGELDLAEDRETLQQTRPHNVHEMLDRTAVELVEGLFERTANEPARDSAPQLRIAVAPVRIQADRQRPVDKVWQARVLIPRELRERAAGGLQQAHALDPASPCGRDDGVGATLEVRLRHRDVAAR